MSMEIFHWGGGKAKILEGGDVREIKKTSDIFFLKYYGGGYAWGTTKKIKEGDVDGEMKNIGGRCEFWFLS